MIDKNDKLTVDAFPPKRRGRPRTSTEEKRRADTAARAKKHREKLSRKATVMAQIVPALAKPGIAAMQRVEWLNLMAFVNGLGEDLETSVDYVTPSGREGHKKIHYSGLCDLIIKGYRVIKFC